MARKVQRIIERDDSQCRAERDAPCDPESPLRIRGPIERKEFPIDPFRLFCRYAECDARPCHFLFCNLTGLPSFKGQDLHEFRGVTLHEVSKFRQDTAAFSRRESSCNPDRSCSAGDRIPAILFNTLVNFRERFSRVGETDL